MPVLAGTLPVSNVGGNNQTSPGLSRPTAPAQPVFTPPQGVGTLPSTNPYISTATTSTPSGTLGSATYNPASSYSSGQTDISKQLIDIYGKGVGGSLNYLLQNLSGTDSAIFQQYLASQVPANAAAEAQLRGGLGAMGVSGNSSVAGIAESNLAAQEAAQAAGVNQNLMTQSIQDTMNILQNTQGAAAKEVATSGWTTFGDVMGNIAQDVGAVLHGGAGSLPGSTAGASAGATDPLNQGQWGSTEFAPTIQPNAPSIDTVPMESFSSPDVPVGG